MTKSKFIGFSTVGRDTGPYTLTDFELVKQDLYNSFFTRPKERIMHPELGCRIWDLLFDPLDSYSIAIAEEEIDRIVSLEPRVQLVSKEVEILENGLRIAVLVNYMNITQEYLFLEFNNTLKD